MYQEGRQRIVRAWQADQEWIQQWEEQKVHVTYPTLWNRADQLKEKMEDWGLNIRIYSSEERPFLVGQLISHSHGTNILLLGDYTEHWSWYGLARAIHTLSEMGRVPVNLYIVFYGGRDGLSRLNSFMEKKRAVFECDLVCSIHQDAAARDLEICLEVNNVIDLRITVEKAGWEMISFLNSIQPFRQKGLNIKLQKVEQDENRAEALLQCEEQENSPLFIQLQEHLQNQYPFLALYYENHSGSLTKRHVQLLGRMMEFALKDSELHHTDWKIGSCLSLLDYQIAENWKIPFIGLNLGEKLVIPKQVELLCHVLLSLKDFNLLKGRESNAQ